LTVSTTLLAQEAEGETGRLSRLIYLDKKTKMTKEEEVTN
jgi:hypothetical protein